MRRLHIEAYSRALAGKNVVIACREGILRDHFDHIMNDIKFLSRQGIRTTLVHNMSNRFANRQHFARLADRLPDTTIVRLMPDTDFYSQVLDRTASADKLVFLERKYLQDKQGQKINAISTAGIDDVAGRVGNVNFRDALVRICSYIENGRYDRVHILPAGPKRIKEELFSIEGSGTLIANNYQETFLPLAEEEIKLVYDMLAMARRDGYIRPRSLEYITAHRHHFFVTRIDNIVVGCAEAKPLTEDTVELGALAISTKFRNQRVGVFTVNSFFRYMSDQGYKRFISLTRNPRLQSLYRSLGFEETTPDAFRERQEQSPGVPMFVWERL